MTRELPAVTGDDGELVRRLVELVRGRGDEPDFYRIVDVGIWLELAVGDNSPLRGVIVHDGRPVPPGSMLERRLTEQRPVAPDEWLRLVTDRLMEIVQFGVAEDFLVTALRDSMSGYVSEFADVASTSQKRSARRDDLLSMADDPEQVARLKEKLAQRDPTVAAMSLEDVAARLRRMADKLQGPDAEEVKARWAESDAWERDLALLLNDDIVERWRSARLARYA